MENTEGAARGSTVLVIDRSRWLRGEGASASRLIRYGDEKMCCLGFYGLSLGATRDDMLGVTSPNACVRGKALWPEWLVHRADAYGTENTDDATSLMHANDDARTPAERESEIAGIFAEHGIEVWFVDGNAAEPPKEAVPEAPHGK